MTQALLKVFCSYSHKYETLRDKPGNHLTLLQREGIIEAWHDWSLEPKRAQGTSYLHGILILGLECGLCSRRENPVLSNDRTHRLKF